jgi:hypothetical protein
MGSSDKAASDDVPEKAAAAPTYKDGASEAAVGEVQEENTYAYDDSRKLGITGAVFLILNKMIGTGIFSTPSGIFAATGSVGISLFLWVIGKFEPHSLDDATKSFSHVCARWCLDVLRSQRLARVRPCDPPVRR